MVLAVPGSAFPHAVQGASDATAASAEGKGRDNYPANGETITIEKEVMFQVTEVPKLDEPLLNREGAYSQLCGILDNDKPPAASLGMGRPRVVLFVSLQGFGVPAACTEYAFHCEKKGWKPALVCADASKADLLRPLVESAGKEKMPFYASLAATDPAEMALEGLAALKGKECDLVIVDVSSGGLPDFSLSVEIQALTELIKPEVVVLMMDSSKGSITFDEGFKQSPAIVFAVDDHGPAGSALKVVTPAANLGTAWAPLDLSQTSSDEVNGVSDGKEQDDDQDENDEDDEEEDDEEEDDDYDNKVEAGGDEEEDLEADDDEADEEEGDDDGEAEDEEDDDGEEGEDDEVNGEEEQEDEDDENGDPENGDEEESDEDVEEVEPPSKKRK